MKTLSLPSLVFLLLTGCATQQPPPQIQAPDPDYAEHRITIQTLPPGAIIDWNGDVVGVSPCEIVIPKSYKGNWPSVIYWTENIRARWPDAMWQEQIFDNRRPAPKRVVFLHPNPSTHYPRPITLSQR